MLTLLSDTVISLLDIQKDNILGELTKDVQLKIENLGEKEALDIDSLEQDRKHAASTHSLMLMPRYLRMDLVMGCVG